MYVWDDEYPWDVRTEKICGTLTRAGHDVHIVARNRRRAPLHEALPEGTVHRMRPWPALGRTADALLAFPAFFSPRWLSLLVNTARRVHPDVMIVRDLPLAPTALWTGQLLGIPVIIDMAENYPAMLRTIWHAGRQRTLDVLVRNPVLARLVERYALPRADCILAVVEESAARLRAMGIDDDRIAMVSNTPPITQMARPRPESSPSADAPVELVYLGYLEMPRGIGELLEAVARVRADGHRISLTLIGDGRDAQLFRRQAAGLGLGPEEVRFLGFLPHGRALDIVATSDIGLVPHQRSEYWDTTIPNKLFDYMAAGIPVVTSDAVPSARVVNEAQCGEVFRTGDAGDLAAAVTRLLRPEVRQRMGGRGRQAVLQRYNWERDAAVLLSSVGRVAEASAYAIS
jgi:glycosyltransferase involved in cell wall biosynthesis